MEPINLNQYIPQDILDWLYGRGLSGHVIAQNIAWNGEEVVIPVRDENGAFLFNKYRRNPAVSDGPKYRYEKGSTVALYNAHSLKEVVGDQPVFVCEGELDALLLNSKGQHAVTSTGGSGTFKKEWATYFEGKNVFIVFDRDEAGYKGAMKTQGILPFAKTIILPDTFTGNDITDYFQKYSLQDFFHLKAFSYPIPREPSGIPTDKKELKAIVKTFGDACDALLTIRREHQMDRRNVRHIDVFLQYVTSRHDTFKEMLQNFDRRYQPGEKGDSAEVREAKLVPITNFVPFSYDGFGLCLWHKEKSGSMKYNKPTSKYPNTVKCFSCGAMGDPIDVIMQMRGVDFGAAIKILLNK